MYKHLCRDINLIWTRTFEFEDIGKYLKNGSMVNYKIGQVMLNSSHKLFEKLDNFSFTSTFYDGWN